MMTKISIQKYKGFVLRPGTPENVRRMVSWDPPSFLMKGPNFKYRTLSLKFEMCIGTYGVY